MRKATFVAAFLACCFSTSASAVTIWDEGVNGDLSGNQNAPSNVGTLSAAVNSISGASVNTDRDFITFTVPVGFVMTSVTLTAFTSVDDLGFMAIDEGGNVDSLTNVAVMMGYVHFGPGPGGSPVGSNTLTPMSTSAGAQGFSVPLAAGQYTLWFQQTNAQNVAYQFDVTMVPEPTAVLLVGSGLLLLASRRARA